jgi:chorismate lyase/3-hydroxybenzoate synthase
MEKTQAVHTRAGPRGERELVSPGGTAAPLGLSYLAPGEFAAHCAKFGDRIMGAIAFGAHPSSVVAPDFPYAWVDMPVLDGEAVFEVWTSSQPLVREDTEQIVSARNDEILFGCLQVEAGDDLAATSYLAYCRIFDFIDTLGYAHLQRAWHYFPQINADDADGLERYLTFNIGRHEAFAARRRVVGDAPAACALGSRSGPLIIYFLAARREGRVMENPRQTSAYRYPAQYGPRSPTFSRGMLMQTVGKPLLFISGTASIVGHQTLHVGNAPEQARETVANILAVIAQAQRAGLDAASSSAALFLKAYLRDADYYPAVRNRLAQAFGPQTKVIYLQADICRSDLLLEVEGVRMEELA